MWERNGVAGDTEAEGVEWWTAKRAKRGRSQTAGEGERESERGQKTHEMELLRSRYEFYLSMEEVSR